MEQIIAHGSAFKPPLVVDAAFSILVKLKEVIVLERNGADLCCVWVVL